MEEGHELTLVLSTIAYKEAKGIPIPYVLSLKDMDYCTSALCSTVFFQTNDGYIVLGKFGKRDRFVGGSYSPEDDDIVSGKDIYEGVYREAMEELGVRRKDIERLALCGGVRMNTLNIALVFYGYLSLSKREVYASFQKGHDPELDDLSFIKTSDFPAYMALKHEEKRALLECVQNCL